MLHTMKMDSTTLKIIIQRILNQILMPKKQANNYIAIKIMSETEALRATIMQEVDGYGSRRRFGLFSSPISTAVGDDGQYKTKLHPRNEQGKPITDPRNFYTSPTRSGQLKKSYFSGINSLASGQIKDEYVDPSRRLLQLQNQTFRKGFNKQQMFKPASGFKELHTPAYQFKEENNPEKDPKKNRDHDGKVKLQPRNFYTNQQSTVIKSFFKPIKYLEDPYERAQQLESERAKKEKSHEGQASFKLNGHPAATFDTERKIYGIDVELREKTIKEPKFNILKHENKWKASSPNKSGLSGYFMPFPAYKEDPPKQKTRIPKNEEGKKDQFRRMSVANSKPSPSIAYHPQNLIRTISHSVSYRQ